MTDTTSALSTHHGVGRTQQQHFYVWRRVTLLSTPARKEVVVPGGHSSSDNTPVSCNLSVIMVTLESVVTLEPVLLHSVLTSVSVMSSTTDKHGYVGRNQCLPHSAAKTKEAVAAATPPGGATTMARCRPLGWATSENRTAVATRAFATLVLLQLTWNSQRDTSINYVTK